MFKGIESGCPGLPKSQYFSRYDGKVVLYFHDLPRFNKFCMNTVFMVSANIMEMIS